MDFKLGEGPWKDLFKGNFEGHDIEIVMNPESLVLVEILEKEGGTVKGAVVEIYKVFYATGDVQGFVETLPREAIAVIKHSKTETNRFFLLGSAPAYVEYVEEKFQKETDRLIKGIKSSTKMLKDVSKAYDLELKELHECDESVKQAFFSQPLMVPLMSTASHPTGAGAGQKAPEAGATGGISFGELVLGITKDGKAVKEPLSMFRSTVVSRGKQEETYHALHIIIEGALLSNISAVVMDWGKRFHGLSTKTSNTEELEKYKVEIDPVGFPVKEFFVPNQVGVDLNILDRKGFTEIFGLGESVVAKKIVELMEENKLTGLQDLIKLIKDAKAGEGFNDFQKSRAARVVKLIGLRYPDLFKETNNIEEISKNWVKGIGRAGLVHMEGQDERVALLVAHSLARGLLLQYKKQGPSKNLKSIFVIPEAERVMPRTQGSKLSQALAEDILEMRQYGCGFALGTQNPIDLAENAVKESDARISIVKGNDAGVQLKGRKSYRVLLRPGLSQCTELEKK